jgi:hypothetical protein
MQDLLKQPSCERHAVIYHPRNEKKSSTSDTLSRNVLKDSSKKEGSKIIKIVCDKSHVEYEKEHENYSIKVKI